MTTSYFENIKSRIIEKLISAEKSVKVISAYFSDKELFDMLCLLSKRGIEVELIIADEPMNTFESKIKYSDLTDSNGKLYLANRNPVQTLVHHKFCLIDDSLIMTGSFNWTTKASANRENLIITDDKETAQNYLKEFNFIKEEYSKVFTKWEEEVIVPSGFLDIDRITKGFKPSELICFTGKSGMGKTNFLLSMSMKISGDFGIPVGFINSNLSTSFLSQKLLSFASKIQVHKFKTGKLEDYEWHEIHKATEQIKELKLYFHDGGVSIHELEKRIKILWYKGAKLIIIDKIDYLLFNQGEDLDNEQNRKILGKFKNIARLLRIPIILVSEINVNDNKYRFSESRRPILSNLGIVARNVDSVISIHREEYFGIYEDEFGDSLNGNAEILIQTHVSGETGMAQIKYDSLTGNFEQVDETNNEIGSEIINTKMGNLNEDDDIPF
jgi:replicative DNA helicase